MRAIVTTAALVASLAAVVLPNEAAARHVRHVRHYSSRAACVRHQANRGTAIGAVAGAVVGNVVGGPVGGRLGGTVIGAGAGAVVGHTIAKHAAQRRC